MAFVERRFFEPPRQTVELAEIRRRASPSARGRRSASGGCCTIADAKHRSQRCTTGFGSPIVRGWTNTSPGARGGPTSSTTFASRALWASRVPCHAAALACAGGPALKRVICYRVGRVGRPCARVRLWQGRIGGVPLRDIDAYNNRFQLAHNRTVQGFTMEEEGPWSGGYDFVQLADPQVCACVRFAVLARASTFNKCSHVTYTSSLSLILQVGMFKMDADWAEVTMLRMAVQHINRLRPKFVLISGDLTNAWPSDKTQDIVAAQVSGFKEVLRELDPSIPLVLQPGNTTLGRTLTRDDVERYVKIWGDDYFSFWVGGVLYISINSQYYHIACDNDEAAELKREQEIWLERERHQRGHLARGMLCSLAH